MFEGFDFANFWEDSAYALKEYVSEAPSDELIASVEQELGYKLPCGPQGEPKVVHIDQERDYEITPLADGFEDFIRGLVNEYDFELED